MVRGRRCRKGFTLVELLVVIGIIALLASILLPVLATATAAARGTRCKSKMQQFFQGLHMYCNNSEEYLPPAWHRDAALAADLSNLSYHRFLIHQMCETNFHARYDSKVDTEDVAAKFLRDKIFWQDAATGWTNDYYAPTLAFRGPMTGDTIDLENTTAFDKHAQKSELVADVPSTERPLWSDVNASYPKVDAKDPKDPGHEAEMISGVCKTKDLAGKDVFVGVLKSLRTTTDETTNRFDFRHNKSANFIFLDGHVDMVNETNKERLHRLHQRWNNIVPSS